MSDYQEPTLLPVRNLSEPPLTQAVLHQKFVRPAFVRDSGVVESVHLKALCGECSLTIVAGMDAGLPQHTDDSTEIRS